MDAFTFVGVEINRKAPHCTFVALDEEQNPVAIGTENLENLISYLSGLRRARVSISAPLNLNRGLLKSSQRVKHTPGKFPNMREIEYEMEQLGAPIYHTPDSIARNDPVTNIGIQLAALMPQMTYQLLTNQDDLLQFFETPAMAAFWSISGARMLEEESLLSRIQRQLILRDLDLPVADAMNFFEELTRHRLRTGAVPLDMIMPSSELNAWVCAYTAWTSWHAPGNLVQIGSLKEGKIILPGFPPDAHLPEENQQQALF